MSYVVQVQRPYYDRLTFGLLDFGSSVLNIGGTSTLMYEFYQR